MDNTITTNNTSTYTLYNETVMEHFLHPRNMGDLKDADGIGEVGAAACFSGETLIATSDGTLTLQIKDFVNKIIPVWSFNLEKNLFEIKNATGVYNGKKKVVKLTLNDDGIIFCTDDHKFLTRPKKEYIQNKDLTENISIYPFKRKVIKNGYWNIKKTKHGKEHIEIFKFNFPDHLTGKYDIHHIDENKRNNNIENLKSLDKSEHTKITNPRWDNPKRFDVNIPKENLLKSINSFDDKSELANHFNIFTDHLIYILGFYEIDKRFKKLTSEEQRKLISERQSGKKNSYFNFSKSSKYKFASKPLNKNIKWKGFSDEQLFDIGNKLYKENGKLTANVWQTNAKNNGYPQCLSSRFPKWNDFKEECINYNHNIVKREYVEVMDVYSLQVEENNNYVVLSRITKNVQEGIVVKNCGDIMKVSIKVTDGKISDAKFKTFGCGSAIAASSMATELIKGRTLEDVEKNFKNEDVLNALGGVEYWKTELPQKIHCSVLSEEAVAAAIEDYKKKNNLE